MSITRLLQSSMNAVLPVSSRSTEEPPRSVRLRPVLDARGHVAPGGRDGFAARNRSAPRGTILRPGKEAKSRDRTGLWLNRRAGRPTVGAPLHRSAVAHHPEDES